MKGKILVIILIVVLVAVSYFAYDLWKKKGAEKDPLKTPDSATPPLQPLPPAPTPPATSPTVAAPTGGLYAVDSGAGQIAVQKREDDLRKAGFFASVAAPQLNATTALFAGTEYGLQNYLLPNIAASTSAAGAERVPLDLTGQQRTAVKAFADLKYIGPGFWADVLNICNAAINLRSQTGVRIFGENGYNTKDLNYYKYEVIPFMAGLRGGTNDTGKNTKGTQYLIKDLARFGQNWLGLSDAANKMLKEQAVQDLRASGWRFVGYDAPV